MFLTNTILCFELKFVSFVFMVKFLSKICLIFNKIFQKFLSKKVKKYLNSINKNVIIILGKYLTK